MIPFMPLDPHLPAVVCGLLEEIAHRLTDPVGDEAQIVEVPEFDLHRVKPCDVVALPFLTASLPLDVVAEPSVHESDDMAEILIGGLPRELPQQG